MPVLQVRGVPEETHRILKDRAAKEGISLTAYVVRELNAMARRADLDGLFLEADRAGPAPSEDFDAATLIRQSRGETLWA
jgi:plasmid stability protein